VAKLARAPLRPQPHIDKRQAETVLRTDTNGFERTQTEKAFRGLT
jgi:hypothetical protein